MAAGGGRTLEEAGWARGQVMTLALAPVGPGALRSLGGAHSPADSDAPFLLCRETQVLE